MTGIQWTDETWNPVVGCSHVSEGCRFCYAETMDRRIRGIAGEEFKPWTAPNAAYNVRLHPERLAAPLKWRKPRRVFVNSMSDLFHEQVPDEFIDRVFAVMALTPQHQYQVLTKRPERMRAYLRDMGAHYMAEVDGEYMERWGDAAVELTGDPCSAGGPIEDCGWPLPNVWLGVSVEDQAAADSRIPLLLETPAAVRFLSCEPLLSAVDLSQWMSGGSDNANQRGHGGGTRRIGRVDSGAGRLYLEGEPQGGHWSGTRLPEGTVHGGRDAVFDGGAPAGVDGGQPSVHPRGDGGQPQERRQGGQSSGEPGNSAARLQRGPRSPQPWEAPDEAYAGSQTDSRAGTGDPRDGAGRGVVEGGDRAPLRGYDEDHPQHRDGREMEGTLRRVGPIHWVIVGGESGPGARPCDLAWIRGIVEQCQAASVPVFVKQLGARPISQYLAVCGKGADVDESGERWAYRLRDRKGGDPDEWPQDLRVREFPR